MPLINLLLSELPLNTAVRFEHESMALVVTRTPEGVTAFEDVCPHAKWPLSGGMVEDGVLICDGHGWEFSLNTGRCLNAPAYCLSAVSITQGTDTVHLEWEQKVRQASACSS